MVQVRFYDLGIADEGSRAYILDETEHFVVFPCIGALVPDYVLVLSKRHVLSAGWFNAAEQAELRQLLTRWAGRLHRSGDNVVLFEHGSYDFRDKGGACYDHAHIHLIATAAQPEAFVKSVAEDVMLQSYDDWIDAATGGVRRDERSYLTMSTAAQSYIGNSRQARSQFFRRHLAEWLGAEAGSWDWLVYPEVERVRAVIEHHGQSSVRP
ncbi:HIT family protein [Nocardia sp. NPDC050630]|uniref:HIT family protein n=1 Tax=Nocardia sp. NPDC050630 TaxID=3364321 RepID=UPI0037ABA50C